MNARRGWVRAQERGRVAVARELWILRLNTRGDGCEAGILDGRMSFNVHRAREHARSLIRGYADNDHARNMCTLGLRILDALEGQPDACQAENCKGGHLEGDYEQNAIAQLNAALAGNGSGVVTFTGLTSGLAVQCPDCRGSGHNLRGVLAPMVAKDWTERLSQDAQLRRRRCDQGMDDDGVRNTQDSWLDDETITGAMAPGWALFRLRKREPRTSTQDELESGALTIDTRVAPRGEHRDLKPYYAGSLDERINARGWVPGAGYGSVGQRPVCAPRWHIGELLHAEQRRARDIDRQIAAASLDARDEIARALAPALQDVSAQVQDWVEQNGVADLSAGYEGEP